MSPGKMAAQAGHAFLGTFECARTAPLVGASGTSVHARRAEEYSREWPGTKIVLAAEGLDRLLQAKDLSEALGLPYYLVTDEGHVLPPHFDGSPIVTALGIGPALRHEVKTITKRFALVP